MSWDGLIMKFPKVISINDLPENWKAPEIGSVIEIMDIEIFPSIENKPGNALIEFDDTWIELMYNAESEINSINIRTNGTPVSMEVLKQLCQKLDADLFDVQTGEIADFENFTIESISQYTQWRNNMFSGRNIRLDSPGFTN